MKKSLAILLVLAMFCGFTAGAFAEETYVPGTYTGEARGFGGAVTVTITTDAESITGIEVTGESETPTVGGAALEPLREQLMAAQSADIDGVAGASMTSGAVKAAMAQALAAASGNTEAAPLTDGVYSTRSTGFSWTGYVCADVTITDGKIASVVITEEHDSETAEVSLAALAEMPGRIVENQSIGVDAVSGATSTSNAVRNCAAQAIELAGGNAADWMTIPAKSDAVEKIEGYDVIVVGLGGSGIYSYCAAAYDGASVFGIEKAAFLGGQTITTTGPMVNGAKSAPFEGIEFPNPDEIYTTWIDYVESEEKADIIHAAVYDNGEHIDFYVNNFDINFGAMILSFVRPEWQKMWAGYAGESRNIFGTNKAYMFNAAMEKAVAMNEKNDYLLNTAGEELIFDGDRIVGVKAVAQDGTTYEVYGDAVILATGGFAGNDEMMTELYGRNLPPICSTLNDGAGIQMGLSAGGATYMLGVDPISHILMVPNMIKNDDLTADQKAILTGLALNLESNFISVDGTPLDKSLTATTVISQIPGYRYFAVYSDAELEGFKTEGLPESFATATSHFMGQGGTIAVGVPVTDLDEILAVGESYGDVVRASSVAELAEEINVDAAALAETLGEDGGYTAVIVDAWTYGTAGGLDVDINMNVLREDGTPIENLFAVGQDSMGVENIEGKCYTPWGGQAAAWNFTSGYLGGHAAAAYGLSK